MAAGGASGDDEVGRVAAVGRDVLARPRDRLLDVDDLRRERVLGREPVVHRDADPAALRHPVHQQQALLLLGADRPAAAVDLDEHGRVLEVDVLGPVDVEAGPLAAGRVVDVADHLDVGLVQLEGPGDLAQGRLQVLAGRRLLEGVEVVGAEPVAQRRLDVGGRAGGVEDQVAESGGRGGGQGQSGAIGRACPVVRSAPPRCRPRSPPAAAGRARWPASRRRTPGWRRTGRRAGRRALAVRAAVTSWRRRYPMVGKVTAPVARFGVRRPTLEKLERVPRSSLESAHGPPQWARRQLPLPGELCAAAARVRGDPRWTRRRSRAATTSRSSRTSSSAASTAYRCSTASSSRCRSASTTRSGSTTTTSTSTGTCTGWRCRRPAASASWPTCAGTWPASRWTARGRCGSSWSSRASSPARSRSSPRCTTARSTASPARTRSRSCAASSPTPRRSRRRPRAAWTHVRRRDAELLARGVVTNLAKPVAVAKLVAPTTGVLTKTIGRARSGTAMAAPLRAPRTSFNGTITGHRTVAINDLSLDKIKEIKNAVEGATVNDVVIALSGGALRRYLEERGELPGDLADRLGAGLGARQLQEADRQQQGLDDLLPARHRHRGPARPARPGLRGQHQRQGPPQGDPGGHAAGLGRVRRPAHVRARRPDGLLAAPGRLGPGDPQPGDLQRARPAGAAVLHRRQDRGPLPARPGLPRRRPEHHGDVQRRQGARRRDRLPRAGAAALEAHREVPRGARGPARRGDQRPQAREEGRCQEGRPRRPLPRRLLPRSRLPRRPRRRSRPRRPASPRRRVAACPGSGRR